MPLSDGEFDSIVINKKPTEIYCISMGIPHEVSNQLFDQ